MIPKVKYYGPQIPSTYAVNMTAAASGSNGITVADDDDIDFGTGNFFIHWEGSLPDWTPASDVPIYFKYQGASSFNFVYVTAAGKLRCYARVGGVVLIDKTSVASIPATDNVPLKITISCVRESASAAGTVSFYASGTLLESQSITAAATVSISNTGVLDICGNSSAGVRYASNTISCIVGNFAPTAAEVLDLCTNGIPASWKWGSQAATTSWTWSNFGGAAGYETFTTSGSDITSAINSSGLGIASAAYSFTASKKYRIKLNITVNSGTVQIKANPTTDLSSGGQEIAIITSANDGELTITFTSASAYTRLGFYSPSSSNFSVTGFEIKRAGATMALLPDTIPTSSATTWSDTSGNTGGGTLPAAGATKVTIRR